MGVARSSNGFTITRAGGPGVGGCLAAVLLVLCLVISCRSPAAPASVLAGLPIPPGAQVVEQVPDPPPSWIKAPPASNDSIVYAVGICGDASDPTMAEDAARRGAYSQLAEQTLTLIQGSVDSSAVTRMSYLAMLRGVETGPKYRLSYAERVRDAWVIRHSAACLASLPRRELELSSYLMLVASPDEPLTRERLLAYLQRTTVLEVTARRDEVTTLAELLKLADPAVAVHFYSSPATDVPDKHVLVVVSEAPTATMDALLIEMQASGLIADRNKVRSTIRFRLADLAGCEPLADTIRAAGLQPHRPLSPEAEVRLLLLANHTECGRRLSVFLSQRVRQMSRGVLEKEGSVAASLLALACFQGGAWEWGLTQWEALEAVVQPDDRPATQAALAECNRILGKALWDAQEPAATGAAERMLSMDLARGICAGDEVLQLVYALQTRDRDAYDRWVARSRWNLITQLREALAKCQPEAGRLLLADSLGWSSPGMALPCATNLLARLAYAQGLKEEARKLFTEVHRSPASPYDRDAAEAYLMELGVPGGQPRSGLASPLLASSEAKALCREHRGGEALPLLALASLGPSADELPLPYDLPFLCLTTMEAAQCQELWGLRNRALASYRKIECYLPGLSQGAADSLAGQWSSPSSPHIDYQDLDGLQPVHSGTTITRLEFDLFAPSGVQRVALHNLTTGTRSVQDYAGAFDVHFGGQVALARGTNALVVELNGVPVDVISAELME